MEEEMVYMKYLEIDKATVENEGMMKANDAMSLAEDWLQAYPDLNVIACMNDDMAIGVIQGLQCSGCKYG